MSNNKPSFSLADAPDVLTPTEAAKLMRVGRNTAYAMVKRGELYSVRSGRRILIPKTTVLRWLGMLNETETTFRKDT